MPGTMTRTINEAVENKLAAVNELLNSQVGSLVRNLKDVKPIFYYQRMIAKHFPDSDFARMIGHDYERTDRELITERNKCISQAIKDNLGEDVKAVEISPSMHFSNVENALKRNDKGHGIAATGLTREKLFFCALVFNLQYDEFIELMKRCIGECDLNYSDPYETILAYCMIEHSNVYSRYMELKRKYEEGEENKSVVDREIKEFSDIKTDDDLLSFVCHTLSEEEKSKDEEKTEDEEKTQNKQKHKSVKSLNAIYNEIYESFKESFKKDIPMSCLDVTKAIYGDELKIYENDPIPHIKAKAFTADNLKKMLNGEISVTKEAMLILLFVKYTSCVSDMLECTLWENAVDCADLKAPNGKLKYIYRDFEGYANEYLREAGFSEIYLPNSLETFLVYCLAVKDDPLETFQIMFSSEKTLDEVVEIIIKKKEEKEKEKGKE